jgi:hypothetical protein
VGAGRHGFADDGKWEEAGWSRGRQKQVPSLRYGMTSKRAANGNYTEWCRVRGEISGTEGAPACCFVR